MLVWDLIIGVGALLAFVLILTTYFYFLRRAEKADKEKE